MQTAASQGIVLFSCAFSAIFIAISAHNYNLTYRDLPLKYPECILLYTCFDKIYKDDEKIEKFLVNVGFRNDAKVFTKVKDILSSESVCQEFQLKIVVAVSRGTPSFINS